MALATSEDMRLNLRLDRRDLEEDILDVYNADALASAATVEVGPESVILVKTGGAGAGTTTLTFATYPSAGELVDAINALAVPKWKAVLNWHTSVYSADLAPMSEADCLLWDNRQTLLGADSWWLGDLLAKAQSFMERYCHRFFEEAAYDEETYDGKGTDLIRLNNYPINRLATFEVKLWGIVVAPAAYVVDHVAGLLWRKVGIWTEGRQNYTVTYTAGYHVTDAGITTTPAPGTVSVPPELKDLCIDIAGWFYHKAGRDPLLRKVKMGSYDRTFLEDGLAPEFIERLALWRSLDGTR